MAKWRCSQHHHVSCLRGTQHCSQRCRERLYNTSICSPTFPLAHNVGHKANGHFYFPFLNNMDDRGLSTLSHDLGDLVARYGACDLGGIICPWCHIGSDSVFGKLPMIGDT